MKFAWRETLRSIMNTAWSLFRRGMLNLSVSLRVAWRLQRREISMEDVRKTLRRR